MTSTLDFAPPRDLTRLHVAYTHKTRMALNETCMKKFAPSEGTRLVPKDPDIEKSQDIVLHCGMPLLCHHTKKSAGEALFANADVWLCESYDADKVQLRRQLEDADGNKRQCDMPLLEVDYAELAYRFYPGYCITVHSSQGMTFREPYTIHDWDFVHMKGRGRYVAMSRGQRIGQVFIASSNKRKFDCVF